MILATHEDIQGTGRTPRGVRGLKRPRPVYGSEAEEGRTPRGVRGLKRKS